MAISKSGRAYFTQEQYKEACRSSALDYAMRRGYDLVPQGNRFYLREHDSMIFLPNGFWHWNSRGLHGKAIDFAKHYEGLSLPEAVLAVVSTEQGGQKMAAKTEERKTAPPFCLPEEDENNAPLLAYLTQTRLLDLEIVTELLSQKRVYMTSRRCGTVVYRNAVFVGYKDGEAKSAALRGIAYGSTLKGEVEGSDKSALFEIPGESGVSCAAVFEGAIDAISHATLQKRQRLAWRKTLRVAQGGATASGVVLEYLKAHPAVRTVRICFDNDDAGRRLDATLRAELQSTGYEVVSEPPPSGKDWNEYLIQQIALIR